MRYLKTLCAVALLMIIASCEKGENIQKMIPCIPSGLGNNVIAFYPFSNGSLSDMSGYGNNLTNVTTASATSDRYGNANCAYEFNRSSTSTEFLFTKNTSFLINLNEFSISLWYQPKDTARYGGHYECLIYRDSTRTPCTIRRWSIGLYDCRRAVFGRTNSVWDKLIIDKNFSCQKEVNARTDTWHHLVATFDQSGIYMKLYRNGDLQEFSIGHSKCSNGVPIYQDIGDLFLGKDYTGKLDDVIIYNKALTQQEVYLLFNMKACCS